MEICPFFFFQAEDGIRDLYVTGVQTCALPISRPGLTACSACSRWTPSPAWTRPCARSPRRGYSPNALDRKSTRLNSSHVEISYAVFCLKKKKKQTTKPHNNKNNK